MERRMDVVDEERKEKLVRALTSLTVAQLNQLCDEFSVRAKSKPKAVKVEALIEKVGDLDALERRLAKPEVGGRQAAGAKQAGDKQPSAGQATPVQAEVVAWDDEKRDKVTRYLLGFTVAQLNQLCDEFSVRAKSKPKPVKVDAIMEQVGDLDALEQRVAQQVIDAQMEAVTRFLEPKAPEELSSSSFDEPSKKLELEFAGFSWETNTTVAIPNVADGGSGALEVEFICTCRYGREGGWCPHFWIAMAWFQLAYGWSLDRWRETPLPVQFEQFVASGDARRLLGSHAPSKVPAVATAGSATGAGATFGAEVDAGVDWEQASLEEVLKREFMIPPSRERLLRMKVDQLRRLLKDLDVEDPAREENRVRKSRLFDALCEAFGGEKEALKAAFDYLHDRSLERANEALVEFESLDWGPPASFVAKVTVPRGDDLEEATVTMGGDGVTHENCYWVYNKKNFCVHLLATFLELGRQDEAKAKAVLKDVERLVKK